MACSYHLTFLKIKFGVEANLRLVSANDPALGWT